MASSRSCFYMGNGMHVMSNHLHVNRLLILTLPSTQQLIDDTYLRRIAYQDSFRDGVSLTRASVRLWVKCLVARHRR